MKLCVARLQIQTLKIINQYRAFYIVNGDGKGEGVRFSAARQRTYNCQSAASIVGYIGKD